VAKYINFGAHEHEKLASAYKNFFRFIESFYTSYKVEGSIETKHGGCGISWLQVYF
jgi:hypothetical protein